MGGGGVCRRADGEGWGGRPAPHCQRTICGGGLVGGRAGPGTGLCRLHRPHTGRGWWRLGGWGHWEGWTWRATAYPPLSYQAPQTPHTHTRSLSLPAFFTSAGPKRFAQRAATQGGARAGARLCGKAGEWKRRTGQGGA